MCSPTCVYLILHWAIDKIIWQPLYKHKCFYLLEQYNELETCCYIFYVPDNRTYYHGEYDDKIYLLATKLTSTECLDGE